MPASLKELRMRHAYTVVLAMGVVLLSPRHSLAQGSVDAFGGLAIDNVSTLADSSSPAFDFGGRVSVEVIPAVQAVAEVGRIGNVLPAATTSLLSLAPFDLRARAFYGEGGLRLLAAPRSTVTPYVEGTVGIARLDYDIAGLGSTADAVTLAALNLFGRTDPIAGLGAGALLRGGPIQIDFGYRYKKIFADDLVGTVLAAGQGLDVHQVRMGFGLRF
jgi:hypothetical protein